MPDVAESEKTAAVQRYLERVRNVNTEAAKANCFLILLNGLFGEQPGFIEDYLAGVEKYLKARKKTILVRGKTDAFYGNVVIEFEKDLRQSLEEAKSQLKRYVYCLWADDGQSQVPYLALATDGLDFCLFFPKAPEGEDTLASPDDVTLEEMQRVHFPDLDSLACYYWLDRYLFRKHTIPPNTENFVKDFGSRSPAFLSALTALESAWEASPPSLVFGEWNYYLRIAYGSPLGSRGLFLAHTFLATLAKILAWKRIAETQSPPSEQDLARVVEGTFFSDRGLHNFLEEDFFSWLARDKALPFGVALARKLINQLSSYDLRGLPEDVLKGIYQELVDPKDRHDLGEYYTPDWLAEKMVGEMLRENPLASVLDPACGSGTFLAMAIKHKRHALSDSAETLNHILDTVAGIDVHPLAVITAKTNYLLALGGLVEQGPTEGRGPITLPIYLANSIKPPEFVRQAWFSHAPSKFPLPSYRFPLEGEGVFIPDAILASPTDYDSVIDSCNRFAGQNRMAAKLDQGRFREFLANRHAPLAGDDAVCAALFHLTSRLHELIRANKDTIWAFILKNFAKPVLLRKKFDVVIGNPPWLSYRYVESGEYQQFLKKDITEKYKLLLGRPELITHMEVATLFFVSTADDYLKDSGAIGFVLPKSVFSGDQHHAFRSHYFRLPVGFTEAWDLEHVQPLFNVPACVFFARKGALTQWPLPGKTFSGKLERKNSSLSEAEKKLAVEETPFFLNVMGTRSALATLEQGPTARASPYKKVFKQGATIVPRAFWFVERDPQSRDPNAPYLKSTTDASERGKGQWKGVSFSGAIEAEFLYATMLSTDLVPFGHLPFRVVILPIEPRGTGYRMVTAADAQARSKFGLASWLQKAEETWAMGRGEKANQMSIYERLDRYRGITSQNPSSKYTVLYPDVNRLMLAAVVPAGKAGAPRFAAESGTYYSYTPDPAEARYICALLNSTILDDRLAPLRRRGQGGQPHVHKKVFDVASIPKFDPSSPLHVSLSSLAEQCSERVSQFLLENPPPPRTTSPQIGRLRSQIRSLLSSELAQIDELVKQILHA
jgi:methylase of polypeptide subunit release factors